MKLLLTALIAITLVFPAPLCAQWFPVLNSTYTVVSGGSYLVSENFDGTGAPSGWTSDGNTDWDYTTTILEGTQSLYHSTNGGSPGGNATSPTFAASSALWEYLIVRIEGQIPWGTDGDARIGAFLASDNWESYQLEISLSNGRVPGLIHGSATANTGAALALDTTYHLWVRYVAGSGSNGIAELYVSTNDTKPGSPTCSISTGSSTGNITNVFLGGHYAGNASIAFDKVRVSTTSIGSAP